MSCSNSNPNHNKNKQKNKNKKTKTKNLNNPNIKPFIVNCNFEEEDCGVLFTTEMCEKIAKRYFKNGGKTRPAPKCRFPINSHNIITDDTGHIIITDDFITQCYNSYIEAGGKFKTPNSPMFEDSHLFQEDKKIKDKL